jgi:nucleotide-binding universal stress UspA family protein
MIFLYCDVVVSVQGYVLLKKQHTTSVVNDKEVERSKIMFKRILVPLDGSPRAERAIPVAARLARASGGSVVLLRAVIMHIEFWHSLVPEPRLGQTVVDADLADTEKYLASITTTPALDGVPTETVVLFGPPASTILSVAHSSHADLIVLCSHGYTGMTHWVLGSVAEKVVRHAPIPVFVLREGGPVPAGPHPDAARPLRVLVPLDGSSHAKTAIEPAANLIAALAAPAQGALHLVRVVKPVASESEEKGPEGGEQFLHKAKRYLSSTVEHLREGLLAPVVADLKLPVTWSVAVDTDVAEAIIRVAENGEDAEGAGVFGGCDLIAMATHGYSGIQHWAMGSITERVLSATKLPLLIVHPQDMMDKSHVTWDMSTLADIQA